MMESAHGAAVAVTAYLDAYDFGQALHTAHDFFWHSFCDVYIEWAKKQNDAETKQTLAATLITSLKLLHPFVPYVTETLWQHIRKDDWPEQIMIAEWPKGHQTTNN